MDVKSGRFASQQTQPLFVHGIGSWNSKQNLLEFSFRNDMVYIISANGIWNRFDDFSGASDGDSEIPQKNKSSLKMTRPLEFSPRCFRDL